MKQLDITLPGRDAVRAVGRFDPDSPTGFRAVHVPDALVRETRAQAWEDAVAWHRGSWGAPAVAPLRVGSLFSGYGGLDLGVIEALAARGAQARVAWHAEIEPGPCRVLAHHWPDAPNLGDISAVDWSQVPRVDVLTGGFPCQDVSLAGLRAGLHAGTRSGLWAMFARAIDVLRPGLVVIENVRGLLSAKAGDPREVDGEMEPDAWTVGDGVDGPVLRALGAVLGDLADLGYDARWAGVRAADAGAPHGRFRVFIVAHPAGQPWRVRDGVGGAVEDADVAARGERWVAASGEAEGGRAWSDAGGRGGAPAPDADGGRLGADLADVLAGEPDAAGRVAADADRERLQGGPEGHLDIGVPPAAPGDRPVAADAAGGGRDGRACSPVGRALVGAAAPGGSGGAPTDADGERHGRREDARVVGRLDVEDAGEARERERARQVAGHRGAEGRDWGPYAAAIARWESVLGRVAPAPTSADGRDGGHRLAPPFVEWMMGLPAGHVTAPAIGLRRTEQLKALGNGVVPQQAALAVGYLLDAEAVAA